MKFLSLSLSLAAGRASFLSEGGVYLVQYVKETRVLIVSLEGTEERGRSERENHSCDSRRACCLLCDLKDCVSKVVKQD